MAWVVVVAAGAMCRNQEPGTGRPMLKAGICLCIMIIVIITAGGATAIDTAGKLRPSQASVSSANQGWAWVTCVRFEDKGHPRTYAVFIKDGKVIDSRYAVQTDACNTQTYAVFDAMGPTRAGTLGPLY